MMKLLIDAELRFGGRSGIEARSPILHLTSHGLDEQEALESLRRGIVAWCEGLQSTGKLERTLKRSNLRFEGNGGIIDVELNPLTIK